jgi:serine/threonine-protein kinase
MTLAPGTRVGVYEVTALIGAGGMGEVYRARDPRLQRDVALKILPDVFAGDAERLARFQREAQVLASLTHPNIGAIYGLEEHTDVASGFSRTGLALVLELIEGPTLADRLARGPILLTEALAIARQIADALDAAHEHGVIHRDLKPENILIKRLRSGADLVKVVDFGLATIVGGGSPSITQPGMVCGTPDYMSPEQGRGDPLDGRSDLYSLGVVLFELLTDKLPFEDDTPTKVLLRHINDPVPDPRAVAPQRSIPDELAEIALRALTKDPAARFQSAAEFEAALRKALEDLRVTRRAQALVCSSCGTENEGSMRFCGSCGLRLVSPYSMPPPAIGTDPARMSFYPAPRRPRPLVGRADDLARLDGYRQEASLVPLWVHLVGEPGVGKTSLLDALAERAGDDGDVVVAAAANPSHAPVPFGPLPRVLAALVGVPTSDISLLPDRAPAFTDPLVREGLRELLDPRGLAGTDGSRVPAVTRAFCAALAKAEARSRSKRIVLIFDDLPDWDGLSMQVAELLPREYRGGLLLLSSGTDRDEAFPFARTVKLKGLDPTEAAKLLSPSVSLQALLRGEQSVIPLLLEQVEAAGPSFDPGDGPIRLADAVAQRIERLDLDSRKLLQAAAVLGDRCAREDLEKLVGPDGLGPLESLSTRQLLTELDDGIRICHPFVRELVDASIPAEARRQLHAKALAIASDRNEPIEVRAEHAYRAGDPMTALVLLERVGDMARMRGDLRTSVSAFRRGLDLARREMLQTGDPGLDPAIVTFSRKLGDVLERSGNVSGADGVLREALDLAGPASEDRVLMLIALGRVAARRERHRDAVRLLGQALDVATMLGRHALCARAHAELGRVRRQEGDAIGAANAFRNAIALSEHGGFPPADRAKTLTEFAEVLVDLGDSSESAEALDAAFQLATEAQAPALASCALGVLGAIDELGGDPRRASQRYAEAARYAASAGDVVAHERWSKAAKAAAG